MNVYSRAIVLLLSLGIALITATSLFFVLNIDYKTLSVIFLLSFLSTSILNQTVLELLFFRPTRRIYDHLSQIKDDDMIIPQRKNPLHPLKSIFKGIYGYTQKKQEEIKRLKELESFRRDFIADVSHELKTPIFSAQGFVLTLLDGAINDKDVRKKFLKKAAKSLDGLDLLVQDILTISQIESGEIKMHYENFDMNELCREVLDQLEVKAEKKGVMLLIPEKTSQSIIVRGDYRRIYQVMINLISNAIGYTGKKGYAKVYFENMGNKIRINIEDNGRGIPKEDLNRIFERFYRVEKSRSRKKGGTGLGLSIVKHILEGHNAQIFVESTLKKGSRFYFDLKKADYVERSVLNEDENDDYA